MESKKRQYGREFQLQGAAAVWQVASQLALRGHNVLFPGLDEGYDIQLSNGLRVQVKCSTLRIHSKGFQYPGYLFGLRRGAWDRGAKKYRRSTLRPYSEVADFFVLWGIDENRFFVVPTVGAGQSLWFTHRGYESKSQNKVHAQKVTASRLRDMEDRWDLLDVSTTSSELIESAVQEKVLAAQGETQCH